MFEGSGVRLPRHLERQHVRTGVCQLELQLTPRKEVHSQESGGEHIGTGKPQPLQVHMLFLHHQSDITGSDLIVLCNSQIDVTMLLSPKLKSMTYCIQLHCVLVSNDSVWVVFSSSGIQTETLNPGVMFIKRLRSHGSSAPFRPAS